MKNISIVQRLGAELLGTALLLAVIIGSGIVGDTLDNGNVAITLLAHSLAVGAILVVLIAMFGPVSGAHFNPVVTFVFWLKKDITTEHACYYILCQILGALIGVFLVHLSFEQDMIQYAQTVRTGYGKYIGEVIATFGLVFVILFTLRTNPTYIPASVGLYIFAAIWFTSSGSFANPAVAIARGISDTFTGIRFSDVPMFIVAECIGAFCALMLYKFFFIEDVTSVLRNKQKEIC
ncbi:MAG: MIP/aquaporin family protein [Pseudomonadota bacterium]